MWNSDNSVNVWESLAVIQRVLGDHRDLLRLGARAHTGRYHQNIIASADSAIIPAKPEESRSFFDREVIRRRRPEVLGKVSNHRYVIGHVGVRNRIALGDAQ